MLAEKCLNLLLQGLLMQFFFCHQYSRTSDRANSQRLKNKHLMRSNGFMPFITQVYIQFTYMW